MGSVTQLMSIVEYYEIVDGNNLAHCVQKSEMELDYSGHLQTGDAELFMPESRNKLKFFSRSQVLKVTATQQPTIATSMERSSHPAKDWQAARKFHKVPDHEKVAASPSSAASQTGKHRPTLQLLNFPGLNDRNYIQNQNLLHGRKEAFGVIECWVLSELSQFMCQSNTKIHNAAACSGKKSSCTSPVGVGGVGL